jgi:hypothetical protein
MTRQQKTNRLCEIDRSSRVKGNALLAASAQRGKGSQVRMEWTNSDWWFDHVGKDLSATSKWHPSFGSPINHFAHQRAPE